MMDGVAGGAFVRTVSGASMAREVPIRAEWDIVLARRAVRETSTALGFGTTETTRIITAASELARNTFTHAGGGIMRVRSLDALERRGIELEFEDQGPGIPDLPRALAGASSTCGGFGLGLPGARRLMDEMSIHSLLGVGTTIRLKKWCRS